MPLVGLLEIVILGVLIALPVWALFRIRSSGMVGLEAVLWVIVVIAVPLLGPLAYLIVRPDRSAPQ